MYAQVRFSLITPQEVTGALKATGSTDPDILAAAKDQIAAPYRPLKWFGIWGIVTGSLCCLLIILAFIGVPVIIFGIWALRRAKKNRETIDNAYAEYIAKVTGQPPLVPGDLRAVSLVLLGMLGAAGAAPAQVPADFHGDWVSAKATCDAAVRFRVEAAKFTLINGKDTQSFGGIEMAGPSYFGPEYSGIQAVAISEFEGDQPVTATFNANEKKGMAQIDYTVLTGNVQPAYAAQAQRLNKLALGKRFPIAGVPLKKCAGKGGQGGQGTAGTKQAAGPSICAAKPGCSEIPQMALAIEDFRITTAGTSRYAAVTLRVTNRSANPLTIGYVSGSGLVTDDRGNRYTLSGPIRGMGEVNNSTFDPKFTLQPGESRDARFEFAWGQRQNQIFGTQFSLDLATRDILPAGADQFQLGQERAWRFTGLRDMGDGGVAAAPAPVSKPAAGGSQPIRTAADPCGVDSRCYFAGPFAAHVTQVTSSKGGGGYQFVKLNVKFTNLTAEPLILCYASRTAAGSDDRGNRFGVREGAGVRGIGTCTAGTADPQFSLQPNQSREASFEYQTGIYGNTVLGTVWTAGFTATELELLAGNQVRSKNEYLVTFKDLTAGGAGAATPVQVASAGAGSGAVAGGSDGTACGDRKWCDDAGIFTAQVKSVTPSKASGYQFVTLNIKVTNLLQEPVVLCYLSGSALGTDEKGNRYGTRNDKVRGIGICSGNSLNPQFQLRPGESRDWAIDYYTGIYRGTVLGVEWKADFTLQRLQPIPGNQIQTNGDYAVSFENLTASGGGDGTTSASKGLLGEINKAIKKGK